MRIRQDPVVHSVPTGTHGRVLVRPGGDAPRGVLVGFHGYGENAAAQFARLEAIPGAGDWTLLSVQALHRFYRGRSAEEVVACWMTREDREDAIADNIAYVDAALDVLPAGAPARIVYAGFSQGVAMAFRAAVRGKRSAAGVIAVGGDVPPELLADAALSFPPVFLARGTKDEWYTAAKLDADVAALQSRGVRVDAFVYDAPHEWTAEVSDAVGRWLLGCP